MFKKVLDIIYRIIFKLISGGPLKLWSGVLIFILRGQKNNQKNLKRIIFNIFYRQFRGSFEPLGGPGRCNAQKVASAIVVNLTSHKIEFHPFQ